MAGSRRYEVVDASLRPPAGADVVGTSKLIETVRASFDARVAEAVLPAYRSAARNAAGEPVFDVPRASRQEPLPNDPRPRSPEVVAAFGCFVYGWGRGEWLRVASSGVAADAHDLEALGGSRIARVLLDTRFDESPWLAPTSG